MVLIKRGIFNPVFAFVILAVLLFVVGAKVNLLSVMGFEDDYLYYDDFNRDVFDESLWTLEKIPYRYPRYEFPSVPYGVSNGQFFIKASRSCSTDDHRTDYQTYLIPTQNLYGKSIKIKLSAVARKPSDQSWGSGSAHAKILMNGVEVYDCYSDRARDYETKTKNCLVELIPSFLHPGLYQVRVDGSDYKVINTSNPKGDGQFKVRIELKEMRCMSSWVNIDYVKFKYEYNCKIEDDEILVFDSFSSGSTINISTLTYNPEKFCLDYPVKARSFEDNGIKTDIRGEVLQRIVRGESVEVPNNEEWKVFYITKYTPDIDLRCGIDEAFDTETGQCVNPNEQVMVGCVSDSDCYIPPNCEGVKAQCIDWQCQYEGECKDNTIFVEKEKVVETEVYVPVDSEPSIFAKVWDWFKALFS